ncbi:Fe-S protein assembly co-chaperone HscB [Propionivibrio limicola]|uniref:Fe-S protein assembly co-chaperone HscB n=1 Tax=Propionivibrio limicola TaxID=167645 RepID=UPI0012920856|nr:Fe-S protein assembly co-chaperone HscB [Propionivibrio limicola]
MAAPNLDFNANHFKLFGLPENFRLDADTLDKRFREIQAQVHPDKFAHAGDAERRLSLQWATHVNEAYQTLRTPLPRAQYLLHLSGSDTELHSNTSMAPEFLMEQMEWREAVEEARQGREYDELEQLHFRVKQEMKGHYDQLARLLDDSRDYAQAADLVRRLMFLEKLLFEIDEALAALEA